jgi:hypothetical protein
VLAAGGQHPGPHQGTLCREFRPGGADTCLFRSGGKASGLECCQDRRAGPATEAEGYVWSGLQGIVGLQHVSRAECQSHWKTSVSGLRGLFAVALDLSAFCALGNVGHHPHQWGRLLTAGACVAPPAVGVRP